MTRRSALAVGLSGCGVQATNVTEPDAPRVLVVEVSPAYVRAGRHETVQLRATAILADHTRVDATSTVAWSTATPGVASVGSSGQVVANNLGTVAVTATLGPVSGGSTVEVTDAALIGILLDRPEAYPQADQPIVVDVTLGWSDGASSDGAAQVAWSGPVEVLGGALFATDDGTVEATYRGHGASIEAVLGEGEAALFADDAVAYHIQEEHAIELPLRNPSPLDTPGFFIDLWVDDPEAAREQLAPLSRWVPTLPAGQEINYYLPFQVVEPETEDDEAAAVAHSVAVFVDPADHVAGGQPAIESRLAALVDGELSSAPELATVVAQARLSADVYWYHLVVENQSAQEARGFYVDAWLDTPTAPRLGATGDLWARVASLPAGARINIDLVAPWSPGDCERCTSWVRVDSLNDVNERASDNTWGPIELEREAPGGG